MEAGRYPVCCSIQRSRLFLLAIAIFTFSATGTLNAQSNFVTPGPNVNAVGTTPDFNILRVPELFRAQQNEPACLLATDNSGDQVCIYNDCRAANWPEVQGDCWIGVSQSRDFGETWTSRLAPGYLGHPDSINMGFAADPALVEAPGTSPGVMYLTYIASFRNSDTGGIFTHTYVKSPFEDGEPYLPVIGQPDEDAGGSEGRFHDKVASILVVNEDDPQKSSEHTFFLEGVVDETGNPRPVTVNLVDHTRIIAYSVFTGEGDAVKILTRRSVNGGPSDHPKKASSELNTVTGVHLSYIPEKGLSLTYRRSADSNETDAIVQVFSTNLGQTWSKPEVVSRICPADAQASGVAFRNFTFPWGGDDSNRFWVFWADKVDPVTGERIFAQGNCTQVAGAPPGIYPGVSRIVGMSSEDGRNWYGSAENPDEPFILDLNGGVGHQVFPFAQGVKGRVDIAWWDTREEEAIRPPPLNQPELPMIYDYIAADGSRVFRTANIYMTRINGCHPDDPAGSLGCTPYQPIDDTGANLVSPVRISRYQTREMEDGTVQELEANRMNLRTHGSGRLAYTGDYGSIGTRRFRRLPSGRVIQNSLGQQPGETNYIAEENTSLAWGENRDVFGDFVANVDDPLAQFLYAAPVLQAPVLQAPVFQANNDGAKDPEETLLADEAGSGESKDSVETALADEADLKAVNEPDDEPGAAPDADSPDDCSISNFQRSYARDSGVYVSYVEDKPSMVALTQARQLNTTQRMIPLFVSNPGTDPLGANFCLHIAQRPADWLGGTGSGRASFLPRPALNNTADPASTPVLEFLDVHVGPNSSASRSVFITSSAAETRVIVNAHEGFCPVPQVPDVPPPGEIISSVQIGQGQLFDPVFCQQNPMATACINSIETSETHNISYLSPQSPVLQAPVLQAPSLQALLLGAPVLQALSLQATGFQAQGEEAPVLQASSFEATTYEANTLLSSSLSAPSFQATSLQAAGEGDIYYQDLTHTVVADANATTTFSASIAVLGLDPDETDVDLIVWQPNVYTSTGFAANGDCVPAPEADVNVIAAVDMDAPVLQAPSLQAPSLGDVSLPFAFPDDEDSSTVDQQPFNGDVTFPGTPGDVINVTTRLWVTGTAKEALERLQRCFTGTDTEEDECLPQESEHGAAAIVLFGAASHGCSINGFTIPDPDGDCISNFAEKIEPEDLFPPVFSPPDGSTVAHEAESDGSGDCCAVSTPGTVPVGISVTDQSTFTVTCSSGGSPLNDGTTLFTFGDTLVNCVAEDSVGNQAIADYTISIVDTVPPVISVPGDITTEATEATGVPVNFTVTATDITVTTIACTVPDGSGGTLPVESGDYFLPGTTHVTCTATDQGGLTDSDSFNVIVNDIGLPTITVTVDDAQPVEATGADGAPVNFTVVANDAIDGDNVTTECRIDGTGPVVVSGSTFPYVAPGPTTTSVTCTVTDQSGNSASTIFSATVDDTTPPDIDIPGDIAAMIGAAVVYEDEGLSASDIVDTDPVITCIPASGSTFDEVSSTEVSCTATDASGNTSEPITFNVVVGAAPGGISTKNSVNAGATAPVTWTWENSSGTPIDVGTGNQDIEAYAGNCTAADVIDDVIAEDPGSSGFQLLAGNINQYNWQTVDHVTLEPLPTGRYCIRVTLLTTGDRQQTGITLR